jgi:MscS family membrane protein
MSANISFNIGLEKIIIFSMSILIIILASVGVFFLPQLIGKIWDKISSDKVKNLYQKIFQPYQNWFGLIGLLTLTDLSFLFFSVPNWLKLAEIPIGLTTAMILSWIGFRIFQQIFDVYLIEVSLESRNKINSEFLIVGKYIANIAVVMIVVFIFAETHNVNVFGLIASLGIGGLAVAFAAQKTLEQLLGGIVLYLDRPFVADDYIGLSDGTFGRVESVGLRSTKIRTSGKGTLVIVPNNTLTQINIENFTGAKKIVSLIYLNFYQSIPENEKALIRQVILESTRDIFGIDPRSTEVIFKDLFSAEESPITQAQINFFILGSGEVSMDLRRQLLDVAKQNINEQLKEYGIAFEIEDKTINVESPITI